MFILSNMLPNLSIPDVPFPVLLSNLIRSRFQAKPATLVIPFWFFSFLLMEELYGTRYQIGSFSLIKVGCFFTACVVIFYTTTLILQRDNLADGAANQNPLAMKPRDTQPNKRDINLIEITIV